MKRPELTLGQVAQLPTAYCDVERASVLYGAPLHDTVCEFTWGRSFLEGAVRAGHVPHAEGTELAHEGLFLFTRGQVTASVQQGEDGEAEMWLAFAEVYRKQAERLQREAQYLDSWAALLRRRAQ